MNTEEIVVELQVKVFEQLENDVMTGLLNSLHEKDFNAIAVRVRREVIDKQFVENPSMGDPDFEQVLADYGFAKSLKLYASVVGFPRVGAPSMSSLVSVALNDAIEVHYEAYINWHRETHRGDPPWFFIEAGFTCQ